MAKSGKAKTESEIRLEKENELFSQYQTKMSENDLPGALEFIDQMLKVTTIHSFMYTLKVDILSQLGRQQEALEASTMALQYPNPSSKLHKVRAELLLSVGKSAEDLQDAKASIDQAIRLYDQEGITEDLEERFQNIESFKFWFEEKTRSRTEMASLKADITSLLYALNILNKVEAIEEDISRDKIKSIELMAIFTAILALIFANVQFVKDLDFQQIIVANIALTIVLTWLLYIAQNIAKNRPLLPVFMMPENIVRSIGKIFGLIIVACLVAITFTATVLFIVKSAEWMNLIYG